MLQRGPDDSARIAANRIFNKQLYDALSEPTSFTRNFDSLPNLSVQKSPDNKLRIYTWTLQSKDGSQYTFYGYLQVKDKKGELKLYTLQDSTQSIIKPESEKLRTENWYGCIYYKIIPVKRSGKTYYTLLGWKAVNDISSKKLIDVLYFDRDIPKFGYSLFKKGKVFRNRILFTYLAQITMSLRYEERKKMIVFDHLTDDGGKDGSLPGGPDGTYDAFKFKRGRWILLNDIDIRSSWKPRKDVPKPFGEE
jgi:hypothetical protein